MRSKDHHLKRRGNRWYLRYDIPADIREAFPNRPHRAIEEALSTTDKLLARRLRDERLRELEGKWAAVRKRLREEGPQAPDRKISAAVDGYEAWALLVKQGAMDADQFETALGESLDRAADRHDRDEAKRIHRAFAIARGEVTPIKEVADEYLATIQHLNESTLYTRRKAISVLTSGFATVEEIDHRKARNFLASLMQGEDAVTKRTVNQYAQAWRGIWRHIGLNAGLWSLERLESERKPVKRERWTEDEYLKLLTAAQRRGERDLVLAIRIAAHTGAAAQGVANIAMQDADTEQPSVFLNETKKDHRPRKIPCHPAILEDVRAWVGSGGLRPRRGWIDGKPTRHDPESLSRRFGRLKDSLGYPPEKVFHSFRHAVANKLENARVLDREVKRLLGHHIPDITFGTYSAQGLGYEVLDEVVRKIEWPEWPP